MASGGWCLALEILIFPAKDCQTETTGHGNFNQDDHSSDDGVQFYQENRTNWTTAFSIRFIIVVFVSTELL